MLTVAITITVFAVLIYYALLLPRLSIEAPFNFTSGDAALA